MDFKGVRVLVMDGSYKQTLAVIRGLKEIGCIVSVLCDSKWDGCYASRLPDEKIINKRLCEWNPAVYTEEEKSQYFLSLLKSGRFDVLMPMIDISTDFVMKNEDLFGKYVKLACAPKKAFIAAFNKQITFDHAIKATIPTPYTRSSEQSVDDFLKTASFPIIIKPRQGLGSIGFHKFESMEEFNEWMLKPSFNIDDYVLQEFVEFDHRIGTLVFMDEKGNVCTSYNTDVLRQFPPDAGSAILIKTTQAEEVQNHFIRLLRELHWQGFAAGCFMIEKKTGEPKLLEINGRIPATVKLAFMCGFNIARQMLEMAFSEKITQYPYYMGKDMYVRHFDTDLAWFLKSKDRFHAKPSWFSWKNTKEVVFSKDDVWPFFAMFLQRLTRYKRLMTKKKH